MRFIIDRLARVWAINAANAALIAILMIGIPAVTGVDLGSVRLSSVTWLERLVMAGLGVGVVVNGTVAWILKSRRPKRVCRGWMLFHGAVLVVAVLAHGGYVDFDWLKRLLHDLA